MYKTYGFCLKARVFRDQGNYRDWICKVSLQSDFIRNIKTERETIIILWKRDRVIFYIIYIEIETRGHVIYLRLYWLHLLKPSSVSQYYRCMQTFSSRFLGGLNCFPVSTFYLNWQHTPHLTRFKLEDTRKILNPLFTHPWSRFGCQRHGLVSGCKSAAPTGHKGQVFESLASLFKQSAVCPSLKWLR